MRTENFSKIKNDVQVLRNVYEELIEECQDWGLELTEKINPQLYNIYLHAQNKLDDLDDALNKLIDFPLEDDIKAITLMAKYEYQRDQRRLKEDAWKYNKIAQYQHIASKIRDHENLKKTYTGAKYFWHKISLSTRIENLKKNLIEIKALKENELKTPEELLHIAENVYHNAINEINNLTAEYARLVRSVDERIENQKKNNDQIRKAYAQNFYLSYHSTQQMINVFDTYIASEKKRKKDFIIEAYDLSPLHQQLLDSAFIYIVNQSNFKQAWRKIVTSDLRMQTKKLADALEGINKKANTLAQRGYINEAEAAKSLFSNVQNEFKKIEEKNADLEKIKQNCNLLIEAARAGDLKNFRGFFKIIFSVLSTFFQCLTDSVKKVNQLGVVLDQFDLNTVNETYSAPRLRS